MKIFDLKNTFCENKGYFFVISTLAPKTCFGEIPTTQFVISNTTSKKQPLRNPNHIKEEEISRGLGRDVMLEMTIIRKRFLESKSEEVTLEMTKYKKFLKKTKKVAKNI